jgi:N-acetylmuramoyl-L-alanine amidase
MILSNTKKVIYLNAGHFLGESGARVNGFEEQIETIKIRDACLLLFRTAGFEVMAVPDELNLRRSIDWVNERAKGLNDGLAIDIHLNSMNDSLVRGAEVFYGTSDTMKKAAAILSREVAKSMGIPDRGAKPDTKSFVGSLGWIWKTNCWALLVEVCFLSNPEDMAILTAPGGYEKAAQGIVNACKQIFDDEKLNVLQELLNELYRIIQDLFRVLSFKGRGSNN